jgi:hypothetical protein
MEICIVRNYFKPLNHVVNIPKCYSAATANSKSLWPEVEQRPAISNGKTILANQKGVALIIALIMLIVLTLIGLSSIGTSIFETKISGHDRFASNAFYAATGGLEVGVNQIPDLTAYSGNIGPDETYRSGRITDSSPQPSKNLGLALKPGYETSFEFKRFQVCATGFSFGAQKEIEAQILLGPYPAGTSYNN